MRVKDIHTDRQTYTHDDYRMPPGLRQPRHNDKDEKDSEKKRKRGKRPGNLYVSARIPVRVIYNNPVCSSEINPYTTNTSGQ